MTSITMAAAQAAESHVDEWRLTWYFLWGYISIPTWTHAKNSLSPAVEEVPSLKISSYGTSLEWSHRLLQPEWEQSQATRWNGASVVYLMES